MNDEQLEAASPEHIAKENGDLEITEKTLKDLAREETGWTEELLETAAMIAGDKA